MTHKGVDMPLNDQIKSGLLFNLISETKYYVYKSQIIAKWSIAAISDSELPNPHCHRV